MTLCPTSAPRTRIPPTEVSANRAFPVDTLTGGDHCVDDAILQRFIRFHHEITVSIRMDALDRLARVLRKNAIEDLTHTLNFLRGKLKVGDLTVANLTRGLVQ